jgi:hypothetical protein
LKGKLASRGQKACLKHMVDALPPAADLQQLALDGASTREDAAIHLVEIIVGCVKHETARNADGDADRAAIKLNYKSLGHGLYSGRVEASVRDCDLANRNARQSG